MLSVWKEHNDLLYSYVFGLEQCLCVLTGNTTFSKGFQNSVTTEPGPRQNATHLEGCS